MPIHTFRKRRPLSWIVCLGLAASTLILNDATAQEETAESSSQGFVQVEMAMDDESGSGPVVISSSSMFLGDDGGFKMFSSDDFGGGWGASKMNPLALLDNDLVREELDLVGDQLDKFQEAQKEMSAQIAAKAKELTSGNIDPASMGAIAKEIAEMKRSSQQQMEGLLLPHQLERLRQVALQMQMQKRGAAKTILSPEIAEELGIDKAQQKRIREREKELVKEMEDRIAKLKEEMKEKLMSELTTEQKAKLGELSGKTFEYKPASMTDRIRKQIEGRMKKRSSNKEVPDA